MEPNAEKQRKKQAKFNEIGGKSKFESVKEDRHKQTHNIQDQQSAHTHTITPPDCVNPVRKQTLTQTAFSYCNIHLLFSSHKSLQNRGFSATGSKETCFSPRVADLKETGAFCSHVSQRLRVCSCTENTTFCRLYRKVEPEENIC